MSGFVILRSEMDNQMDSGKAGMKEIFVVALHTLDRGVDDFDDGAVLLEDAVADPLDSSLAGTGVADDAALADVLSAGFELRLDEDHGRTLPQVLRCAESTEHRGKDEGSRYEGNIHR